MYLSGVVKHRSAIIRLKGVIARFVVGAFLAFSSSTIAIGADAILTWTEPVLNDDGSPLTDLTSYEIWSGCNQSGTYDSVDIIPAPATSHTVLGLADVGTCYFAAKATNSVGASSVFSLEASKLMAQLNAPGPVTDTTITWQESPVVAFSFIQDDATNATGASEAFTSSVTAGSLLVAVIRAATSGADPIVGVSDDIDGAWARAVYSGKDADNNHAYIYYRADATGGTTTVTIDAGGLGSGNLRMGIAEYSAPANTILVGSQNSSQQSATTNCNSGSASTTSTDAMAFGGAVTGGGRTFTAGGTGQTFTKRDADSAQRVGMQDDTTASSGASESVMTINSNDFTSGILAFFGIAEGGGGGASTTINLTLLGTG